MLLTPIECYVTKLFGYRLESKASNKTLGFPINLKIMINPLSAAVTILQQGYPPNIN